MADLAGSHRGGRGTSSYRPPPLLAGSLALHAASALAFAVVPRHWRAIAGVLATDHLILAAASLWPRGTWVGANQSRLPAAAARRGEVALTFDDGPDPDVTPRVLDLLDRHDARATFFCIGERVRAHREIAAEIARRGHRVENHTETHPHLFACYPAPALRREISQAQESIVRASGQAPRLFRAPAGLRNPLLDAPACVSSPRPAAASTRWRRTREGSPAASSPDSHRATSSSSTTGPPAAKAGAIRLSWRSSPGCWTIWRHEGCGP